MTPRLRHMSLLWKILLSTSIAITILFAVTGWIVEKYAIRMTSLSLEEEVRTSFHAYESLWRSRAEMLASVSMVLSRMSDVRAAFGTGDRATIRDTARELWDKIAHEGAIFLVTDPQGQVIASLGGFAGAANRSLAVVRQAAPRFPKQASGFMLEDGRLYQIAVTPVYVEAGHETALLDVLAVGYAVDQSVARQLKQATGGSDFAFVAGGRTIASTIDAPSLPTMPPQSDSPREVAIGGRPYLQIGTPLLDINDNPIGELCIFRSVESSRQRIATLQRNMIGIWLGGVLLGLALTYLLARRILEPVRTLDAAAAEIGRGNYGTRVPPAGSDELGRLANTFNAMCASLQQAREELIRQERIATIGRLSTSLVHDLRNPLAAIYGGAEMLVDDELSQPQVKRLAANIYRSSRRIQEMLQELAGVSRGRSDKAEPCRLRDIVAAAYEVHAATADAQSVEVRIDISEHIELPVERSRVERVFVNMISNALEAMPGGGALRISAKDSLDAVVVEVEDTGPGISQQVAAHLFQPFVSAGKKNGLGLGLALSRQTILDHGGNLWVDSQPGRGARFFVRLPR